MEMWIAAKVCRIVELKRGILSCTGKHLNGSGSSSSNDVLFINTVVLFILDSPI